MSLIRMPSATAAAGHRRRDACSLPFPDRLVTLATDKNHPARSRFADAHEIGHLVMHGEHVWGLKQVESQAHAFAAAFLMPDRDILDELPSYADWPTPTSGGRWQVSLAALLSRAKNLGRMTDASGCRGSAQTQHAVRKRRENQPGITGISPGRPARPGRPAGHPARPKRDLRDSR
jgi:Zn-dependent peptidase ImmA (M78 family)